MHKSKGNAIWFDEARRADGRRRDALAVLRRQPDANLNFGYQRGDEVRRRFILPLWNSYSFFVTYARARRLRPDATRRRVPLAERTLLDRWIISRLNQLIAEVRDRARRLRRRDAAATSHRALRRRRALELVHPPQPPPLLEERDDRDKAAAYQTLYEC